MAKGASRAGRPQRLLTLLRHAKSSWTVPGKRDVERPLNARGRQAVPMMAAELVRLEARPQLVLCSSAMRARQTLDLVLPALKGAPEVLYEDALYLASPRVLLARLHRVGPDTASVLMIGHNPGLHALALDLTATGARDTITQLTRKLPTAGLVLLGFDAADWTGVMPATGHLIAFKTPKGLGQDADD